MLGLDDAPDLIGAPAKQLAGALLKAERRRIAREIHDRVGHQMACLKLQIQSAALTADDSNLSFAAKGIDTISKSIHDAIYDLYDEESLNLCISVLIKAILDDWGRQNKIFIGFYTRGTIVDLDSTVAIALMDVVREATTNITKHALCVRSVTIRLSMNERFVKISIRDDGLGIVSNEASRVSAKHQRSARRFGFAGMRERMSELQGAFAIRSKPGKGTLLMCRIPLERRR